MTDNEIIKALECCIKNECEKCNVYDKTYGEVFDCLHAICENALDLINRLTGQNERLKYELKMMLENAKAYKFEIERLKEVNDNLAYTIVGVMLSVDKWLEGDELEQDEVIRAATMREKTLQIVELKQAEIERLQGEVENLNKAYPCKRNGR